MISLNYELAFVIYFTDLRLIFHYYYHCSLWVTSLYNCCVLWSFRNLLQWWDFCWIVLNWWWSQWMIHVVIFIRMPKKPWCSRWWCCWYSRINSILFYREFKINITLFLISIFDFIAHCLQMWYLCLTLFCRCNTNGSELCSLWRLTCFCCHIMKSVNRIATTTNVMHKHINTIWLFFRIMVTGIVPNISNKTIIIATSTPKR